MASVIVIGDSHLEHCYNKIKPTKSLNFGFQYNNLKVHWERGIEQLKNLEKSYKETITKCGEQPDAVFVLCGGYELMITKDPKGVVNKLKAFVHFVRSSNVKLVVVCSILDRRCGMQKEEEAVNREVRSTNKMLAKAFKDLDNVFFINIRPPGNVKNIIDDDKYHLKEECYEHVYRRLSNTFTERILPHLSVVVSIKSESNADQTMEDISVPEQPSVTHRKGQEPSMDKRLNDFKKTLREDYERFCEKEKQLMTEFIAIQAKLEKVTNEKKEAESVYKRLFGVDLNDEKADKV